MRANCCSLWHDGLNPAALAEGGGVGAVRLAARLRHRVGLARQALAKEALRRKESGAELVDDLHDRGVQRRLDVQGHVFAGVVVQVEQQRLREHLGEVAAARGHKVVVGAVRALDVEVCLPLAVANRVQTAGADDVLVQVEVVVAGVALSGPAVGAEDVAAHVHAVVHAVLRRRDAGDGEHRREQVHRRRDLPGQRAGLDLAGPLDDAGHPLAALPRRALSAAEKAGRAATLETHETGAVVGGEEDECVVLDASLLDGCQHLAQRPVQRFDRVAEHAALRRVEEGLAGVVRVVRVLEGVVQEEGATLRVGRRLLHVGHSGVRVHVVQDGQVRGLLHDSHALGRAVEQRDLHHAAARRRRLQPVHVAHLARRVHRLRRRGRETALARRAVRVVEAVRGVRHVVRVRDAQPALEAVLRGQVLPLVADAQVPLADHTGLVAVLQQQGGEGRLVGGKAVDALLEEDAGVDAGARLVAAGQQAGPARGAHGRRRVDVGKLHALRAQLVHVGGVAEGVSIATQVSVAQVVRVEDDQVRARRVPAPGRRRGGAPEQGKEPCAHHCCVETTGFQ
eukprot:Rhum_TRINITY_DN8009_c1_g1::Rhum_TRINITY_DN8009_c1_g1_i1::g.25755::m.25755